MNANEMLDAIEQIFPDAQCELYHHSTFQLLVAVVLSAQTTDAAVNKVTPALFEAYKDPQALANARLEDVEGYIQSIGLYHSKARNLIALSAKLLEEFDGQVPSSHEELARLPGVGRKTANVVRSVAFDIPSFAVDTHVDRVSKRLGLADVSDSVEKVEEKLKAQIDEHRWNQGHHDMIFFGRYFCTAKKPNCQECPFASFCHKDELEAWKQAHKPKRKKAAA